MEYSGKKLLILAGAGAHCKVVEAAHEMGIYTIVADYLPNSPAKLISDESYMYDIFDVDSLVELGKEKNIDGVLGFCIDPTQKPAQQIAQKLGLPMFGTEEQVHALTNKKAFKALCRENKVDIIPEYSEEDIHNQKIEFPVLVKPVDSRGSRGAAVCRDYEQLKTAIPQAKAESSNGGVIIEKYMEQNQDLSITYIVKDGKPVLISIGDRYPGREEDNLNRQLSCTIQPSRYASMYMEKVNDRVVNMIRSLGIKNGPVFMQGFVDGDTVRMYDPGIRFPGNEYERIYNAATGMNPMKSIISYVVGGEIDDYGGKLAGSYDLNGMCAIQYMINVGPGIITRYEGLDEIAKLPYVVDVQQKRYLGAVVENTGDIKHRAGEVSICVERDPKIMKDAIEKVQSILQITDENGENMLISPINGDFICDTYSKT